MLTSNPLRHARLCQCPRCAVSCLSALKRWLFHAYQPEMHCFMLVRLCQKLKSTERPPFLDLVCRARFLAHAKLVKGPFRFTSVICSLTFCLWPTGTKLETTGNHLRIVIMSAKTNDASITNTKLVIKYSLLRTVYSANLSPSLKQNHGLTRQFIQMELSGFNAEHNQNK